MKTDRFPFSFARDQQVILEQGKVWIGPNPASLGLREAQRRLAPGPMPQPIRLDRFDFEAALTRVYQESDGESPAPAHDLLFDLEQADGHSPQRDLLEDAGDAPVIQLVNQLLKQAVLSGASDLHIEPSETGLRVRMRVDGFLQPILQRSDVPVKRIVSRLKVMAGLDIAETRLPQDGRIPLAMGGRKIDTRVSSLPGNYGERIVLRILDRSSGLRPLADLGLSPAQVDRLDQLSAQPNGIILATGPTGAGKTTTLYSLLQLANREERNIVTVEDPIEYDLQGISQSQINADIGMTFAAGLRATLRQDPDVVLVGEIRDSETATVASQAALTGHLVLSSLHANSSVGAIVRLRDLGIDNFLIAATLRGVIAQRLLRRLCAACIAPDKPDDAAHRLFSKHQLECPNTLWRAQGCSQCANTGYAGRVGIFEMLTVGEDLRAAIDSGANETELAQIGLDPGERLIGQSLQKVALGQTTLSEALRVVGDVS